MSFIKFLLVPIVLLLNLCISGFAQQSAVLYHGGSIQAVDFSPVDASLVVSASDDNTIKLWNLQNDSVVTLSGHTDKVNSIAFSPNGQLLVSGSNDRSVKLWDVHQKQNIATLKHKPFGSGVSQINAVAFSPDGEILASAGYKSVKLWNTDNQIEIATLEHEDWVYSLVISPDGKYLAAVDGKMMKIWNMQKRQVVAQLEGDSSWIGAIAFSPDNQFFASGGSEGIIKLWSLSNWEVFGEIKDVSSVSDLAFSPNSKTIVSAGNDVSLWSVENGRKLISFKRHTGWVMDAAFSHDGSTVVSGGLEDGTLRIEKLENHSDAQVEPYIVRLIYFLPRDRSPQPDIDAKMDTLISTVQRIYEAQMQHHGFGRKTFKFETDTAGKAVVHHVKGKFDDIHYHKNSGIVWEEIDTQFNTHANIYLTALDISPELLNGFACGFGGPRGDFGGTALIPASGPCFNDIGVTVHELGHAFGLTHDYRNNLEPWVDLYTNEPMSTSFCAAHWLDAHRYFNTISTGFNQPTTIQMAAPTRVAAVNVVRLKFKITDPDGLHQAQILVPESDESSASKLLDFKPVNGEESNVEFVTSLLTPQTSFVRLRVIDKRGYFRDKKFPIIMTSLLPPAKTVSIPDANLASAIRKALNLTPDTPITQWDMLNLVGLDSHGKFDASSQQITDIRGIEYATNLTSLDLSNNLIQDLRPIAKLENLRVLNISENQIRDITLLTEMKNLRELSMIDNPVKYLSPLRRLLEKRPYMRHDVLHLLYPVDKITGPWLWLIAPTEPRQGGANSIDVDSLATYSYGAVSEDFVAASGAQSGDIIRDYVWTPAEISDMSDNNVNDLVNKIGFVDGGSQRTTADDIYVKDHSSYALITLQSANRQPGVRMLVGSDDAIKVWLNGKVVYRKAVNRGAENFQNSFLVDLKAGNNLLLVKVSQSGVNWSMFVGIDADVTIALSSNK